MTTQSAPQILLTIDTEEEWDWHGPFPTAPFSTRNINRIPKFQEFCSQLSVVPTYFIDYAVIQIPEHQAMLRQYFDRGECDVGAHLHPWCNPPIREQISAHNSHAINLDLSLFKEKMSNLTQRLQDAFGVHPFSFRSGRWGLNGEMLEVLAQLGYQADSSVRPFYADTDFSYDQAPTQPYYPSFQNLLSSDSTQTQILELPVSSGFNRAAFETFNRMHNLLASPPYNKARLIGILWKTGLLRKITLTPEGFHHTDLCRVVDKCIQRGDKWLVMFLHSSDLLPGNTDYVKTAQDENDFYDTLRRVIEYAQSRHNAQFVSLRQAHEQLTRSNSIA